MHHIPEEWEIPLRGCKNCDVADANCAAYRHALKDISRGDGGDAQIVALKALDNHEMNRLGKAFHVIVKYAVQLALVEPQSDAFTRIYTHLRQHVNELDEGATVRGWRGDIVKS